MQRPTVPVDYGRCPCSGTYEGRSVEVRFSHGGASTVVTDVPQGACPLCGSRVYKPDVLERIATLMREDRARSQP